MSEIMRIEDNVKLFSNETFGSLQVLLINDCPWFLASEIATI